jgi:hypothetical protein
MMNDSPKRVKSFAHACSRWHAGAWLALSLLSGTAHLGCAPTGPDLGLVQGTVTLNGKPLAGALLEFQPADLNGTMSTGVTDATGNYELRWTLQRMGANIGDHQVRIWTGNENEHVRESLPARFNHQSELRREVKKGQNQLDFQLQLP